MFKACSRCGKIHDSKYKCNVGRVYKSADERKMRSSYLWTKKSEEIREKAQYLCEVCRDQGKITYDNLEVHHIISLREDSTLLLDNNNLICLCISHHKQAESGQISRDYLKKLAMQREKDIPHTTL